MLSNIKKLGSFNSFTLIRQKLSVCNVCSLLNKGSLYSHFDICGTCSVYPLAVSA